MEPTVEASSDFLPCPFSNELETELALVTTDAPVDVCGFDRLGVDPEVSVSRLCLLSSCFVGVWLVLLAASVEAPLPAKFESSWKSKSEPCAGLAGTRRFWRPCVGGYESKEASLARRIVPSGCENSIGGLCDVGAEPWAIDGRSLSSGAGDTWWWFGSPVSMVAVEGCAQLSSLKFILTGDTGDCPNREPSDMGMGGNAFPVSRRLRCGDAWVVATGFL